MDQRRARGALLLLSFVAFISLGLPDVILGVAWPSIRHTFELPISQLGWLLLTGMLGYLSSSFLGGWLTQRLGVGTLLLASSAIITAALAGYASAPGWGVMVGIGILSGLGAGAIDSGINAYAARHFSARVINWLHACWGIGATIGPTLMTAVLVRGGSWRVGYAILSGMLALMTIGFAMTVRLWRDGQGCGHADLPKQRVESATIAEALAHPIVWIQIAMFFLYTGLECTVGQLVFSLLTESRGVSIRAGGLSIGSYWAGLTFGRIVFGFLATSIGAALLLRIALVCAPCCIIAIWFGGASAVALAGVALLGFSIAPIYPLMISMTPQRVGERLAAHSVGFQVSFASLGAAAVPAVGGWLAGHVELETLPPYMFGVSLILWAMFEISCVARFPAPARVVAN